MFFGDLLDTIQSMETEVRVEGFGCWRVQIKSKVITERDMGILESKPLLSIPGSWTLSFIQLNGMGVLV